MGGETSFCQNSVLLSGFGLDNPIESYTGLANEHKESVKDFNLSDLKRALSRASSDTDLLNDEAWGYIFSRFEKFYLDSSQKEEFLNTVKLYHEYNTQTGTYLQDEAKTDLELCKEIGRRFHQLENRVYFKHKYCLQYCKFMTQNAYGIQFNKLNFDMSRKQTEDVSARVRNFCNQNLNAFAFISHYFQIALEKCFTSNSNSSIVDRLKNIERTYLAQISNLEKLYPASNESGPSVSSKIDSFDFSEKFEVLYFQDNQNSHYDQLVNFIIEKSQNAKKDLDDFIHTAMDICYEKGYGFKYGVKIQDSSSRSSIYRTIEKLLTKAQIEKNFKKQKDQLNTKFQQKMTAQGKSSVNLKQFVQQEKTQVQQKIHQILEKETQVEFNIKDLIRGKCTFDWAEDIGDAVKKLKSTFSSKGWKVVELKNRLSGKTRDATLIIKLPNSIAELQLALKLDVSANQFNHKIYELARAEIYTPVTNLFVQNEQWAGKFFTEQMDLFYEMNSISPRLNLKEGATFSSLRSDVTDFNLKFLKNHGIVLSKEVELVNKERKNLLSKFQSFQKSLNQVKLDLKFSGNDVHERKTARRQHETSIYMSFYDNDKAVERYKRTEGLETTTGRLNYNLVKGAVLREKLYFNESEHCYNEIIPYLDIEDFDQRSNIANVCRGVGKLYSKFGHLRYADQAFVRGFQVMVHNPSQITDIVDMHLSAALLYHKIRKFGEASVQIHQAKKFTQNNFGKESRELIPIYNSLGKHSILVQDQITATDILQQSLSLCHKLTGKDSPEVGQVYALMGEVSCMKGQHKKSLDYYEKAFEIHKKFYGPESSEIAVLFSGMGQTYQAMKDYKKAQELFEKRLEIETEHFGKDREGVAQTYALMCKLYKAMGDNQKAVEYGEKSLKIYENLFGKYNMIYAQSALILSEALVAKGKKQQAKERFGQIICFDYLKLEIKEYMKNNAKQKLSYLQTDNNGFVPKPNILKLITSKGYGKFL